jgi:hypothetical protein
LASGAVTWTTQFHLMLALPRLIPLTEQSISKPR